MRYRKLGRTDVQVSVIALGGWSLISDRQWGEQDEAESVAAVHAALDGGINFIDTAEGYGAGASETLLGKALGARRKDVVIASKVSAEHLRPDQLRAACEASLQRLQTEHIDLYQIHWPNHEVPFEDSMAELLKLQTEGKIAHVGVSNFGKRDLPAMLDCGRFESNQLNYSLLWRAIEHDIQPLCVEHQVGILCYSPLLHGLLTGKFAAAEDVPDERARTRHFGKHRALARHGQDGHEAATFQALADIRAACEKAGCPMAHAALAWLLARPAVTSVIMGVRNAGQVQRNVEAADLELSPDTLAALDRATESLKAALGPDADMWVAPENSRMR